VRVPASVRRADIHSVGWICMVRVAASVRRGVIHSIYRICS